MERHRISAPPNWRLLLWGGIAFSLTIPALAMHFTDEVSWTMHDFVMAALLLFGAAALYEIAAIGVKSKTQLAILAGALTLIVVLAWAEASVGIF